MGQPDHGYPPPRRNRTPLFITIGATVAVLVIIGVVAAMLLTARGDQTAAPPGNAGDAAKAYLEALSRGDAQTALDMSASRPASSELLTDEVLQQQLAQAPITDIEIFGEPQDAGPSEDLTGVPFVARVGDQRQEGTLYMVLTEGSWKVRTGFVKVTTSMTAQDSAGNTLLVFGKPVTDSATFFAFPGYLELSSASPYLDVDQPAPLTFGDLGAGAVRRIEFSLTDEAQPAVEEAVRTTLTRCFSPGPKDGICARYTDFGADYDSTAVSLSGPLDLSRLGFGYSGWESYVTVVGTVPGVSLTIRPATGQPVSLTTDLWLYERVDITEQPPVVQEQK